MEDKLIFTLIFPGELCVAQGMGWFDDQLNFDSSVSVLCLEIRMRMMVLVEYGR